MRVRNLPIAIISLPGLLLFLWPFFGSDLPASTPAWTLTLAAVSALLLVEVGTRQLDSRGLALLAAIAAIDTVLRLAVIEGRGSVNKVMVASLAGLAGRWRGQLPGWRDLAVLALIGAVMGWVVGALWDIQDWVTVYRGNPTLGWDPGMSAATTLVRFGRFYLVTSLAYDTFRAVGNVIMVLVLGAPVLAALSRLQARLSFEIVSQT